MDYKSKSTATAAATRYRNERDECRKENERLKQTIENLNQGLTWLDWRSFAIGVLVGIFALAILGLAAKIVIWAVGVIVGSLEILLGLAILALVVWGAVWLFRKIADDTHLDWDDAKARVISSWKHRGGES